MKIGLQIRELQPKIYGYIKTRKICGNKKKQYFMNNNNQRVIYHIKNLFESIFFICKNIIKLKNTVLGLGLHS